MKLEPVVFSAWMGWLTSSFRHEQSKQPVPPVMEVERSAETPVRTCGRPECDDVSLWATSASGISEHTTIRCRQPTSVTSAQTCVCVRENVTGRRTQRGNPIVLRATRVV
jgi:hypothetical protein